MPTSDAISTTLVIFGEHLPSRPPAGVLARTLARRARPVADHLVLPFEQRQKTRQRLKLASGREIGVQLPRGTVLRGGDRLRADDGTVIEVVAAPERVTTVRSRDLKELARIAYHLGNRHVALEVSDGWVRYLTDHVLDAMVVQLGLPIMHEVEPFEPEAGAYGGHAHSPASDHAHAPSHAHAGAAHAPAHAPGDTHGDVGHRHAHARDAAGEPRSDLPRPDGGPHYVYGPRRDRWHPHGR